MKTLVAKLWLQIVLFSICCAVGSAQSEPDWTIDEFVVEGFTEAIEDIHVAVAETGVVQEIAVQLGQAVEKDELMVRLDSQVLRASLKTAQSKAKADANLQSAIIEHDTLAKRLIKVEELLGEGAARPEELVRAKADAQVAFHKVAAIREQLEVARYQLKELEAQIERKSVRSPIQGIVVELYRKPGEHVAINAPQIVRVVDLSQLRVTFHLPTPTALLMNVNDRLKLHFPETNQSAMGVVEYVSPITNADSRRVRVDVLIDNANGDYRSGLRCNISDQRFKLGVPSQDLNPMEYTK